MQDVLKRLCELNEMTAQLAENMKSRQLARRMDENASPAVSSSPVRPDFREGPNHRKRQRQPDDDDDDDYNDDSGEEKNKERNENCECNMGVKIVRLTYDASVDDEVEDRDDGNDKNDDDDYNADDSGEEKNKKERNENCESNMDDANDDGDEEVEDQDEENDKNDDDVVNEDDNNDDKDDENDVDELKKLAEELLREIPDPEKTNNKQKEKVKILLDTKLKYRNLDTQNSILTTAARERGTTEKEIAIIKRALTHALFEIKKAYPHLKEKIHKIFYD
ncbi:coiled-coil domain-containing protein 1-like [Oscarella lobularis]|uniref:coiled-coil domain-containing protein 1-like n=1 Tax=Oscarella lobularis TaxID=121494 RepID=UPI003313B278